MPSLLIALGLWLFADDKLPVLEPNTTTQLTISSDDPGVRAPILSKYTHAEPVAKSFELRPTKTGVYSIDLKSHYFDSYLVLRVQT